MITKIKKRDGREVPFNIEKIANAIFKAAQVVGGRDYNKAMELAEKVAEKIENDHKGQIPTVEQVQDTVEYILIETGHSRTAKSYILYRAERTRVRDMNTSLMKIYEELTFKSAKESDLKRENANVNADTAMGTMLKYGSEGAKQFYDIFILDPKHSAAHKAGDIQIHDLDFYTLTTTCCQIDLKKLFTGGFCTGHGFLREPTDIQSYAALACIAIQSNQNDQHGGQGIPSFDYHLADGVRKTYKRLYRNNLAKAIDILCNTKNFFEKAAELIETVKNRLKTEPALANSGFNEEIRKLISAEYGEETTARIMAFTISYAESETERATFQAMEALIHNLNTMHSRAGAQTPFSSINYGIDTTEEGRMVTRNVLLATEAGLGNGETPIFPIHIFRVKEGINYNPGEPNYDLFKLALRVSAKRLFPNFSFMDAPFNLPYFKEGCPESEVAYMGCRTRVMANVFDKNKEITPGRGNLSFTSINLPRIALNSKGNLNAFYDELDRKIDLAFEQMLDRFKIQATKKARNMPFLMGQGVWIDSETLGAEDEVGEVLKHGTLSLGFIGLAETLVTLTGKHHGESEEAQNLGLEIIGHMRRRCDDRSKIEGMNFTLLATPAEGLSGRFIKIDKQIYGEIERVTDREYYTNSFHIPVYYSISAEKKIKLEAPYHALTNAGHITYVELDGDPVHNLEAFEKIIRIMKENGIGYGSINHPVDRDPVCGYNGIIGDECPSCHRRESDDGIPFERIRRITGYLVGTLDSFNNAKRAEEHDRLKHKV